MRKVVDFYLPLDEYDGKITKSPTEDDEIVMNL